jgi:large exoprotein involved in heme utilization and adhesion
LRVLLNRAVLATLLWGLPYALQAQTAIKTDASWNRTPSKLTPSAGPSTLSGNRGASYSISGNVYTIPQTLGKAAGANLFHSFDQFSVGSGDAAVFTTASSFNNVISRVSGSTPSSFKVCWHCCLHREAHRISFSSIRTALRSAPVHKSTYRRRCM